MTEHNYSKASRQMALAYLILMNLIPLYGVFGLGWDAKLLLLAYFIETFLAVIFHAARLWYLHFRWGNLPETIERSKKLATETGATTISKGSLPLVMLAVFGAFWFIQLMILGGFAEKAFPDGIFTSLLRIAQNELAWVTIGFILLQFMRLVKEIFTNQYRAVPIEQLFFQPFRRIVVQQLVVILGGFVMLFGGSQPYLIVLVLINLLIDLFFFNIESARLKAFLTKNDAEKEKQYEEMKKMLKY